MNDSPNFDMNNLAAPHMQHRAVIAADGSVSLIATVPGITIEAVSASSDGDTEVPLNADEFVRLHEMSAPADKLLTYDQSKRKFRVRTIKR